jgi:hypothetical protein
MLGTVLVPNPTVFTLHLGNVTYDVSVDGQSIGTSMLNDLVLRPGDNHVPMRTKTDQLAVLTLIGDKYKNGVLPLSITGKSVMYNGQTIPYFEAAVKAGTQHLDLNVTAGLADSS